MPFGEIYEYNDRHHDVEAAVIPGTDEVIRSHSTEETSMIWRRECDRRGIVLDNPYRTFGDCACRAMTPEWRSKRCKFLDDTSAPILKRERLIGVNDVWHFLNVAKDWWRSEETVPQELANQRAATCAMCQFNVATSTEGCVSCSGILSKLANGVRELIGSKSTTSDHRVGNCEKCGCVISVLAHVPIDVLRKHEDSSITYPSHCWKVTE